MQCKIVRALLKKKISIPSPQAPGWFLHPSLPPCLGPFTLYAILDNMSANASRAYRTDRPISARFDLVVNYKLRLGISNTSLSLNIDKERDELFDEVMDVKGNVSTKSFSKSNKIYNVHYAHVSLSVMLHQTKYCNQWRYRAKITRNQIIPK